MKGSDKVKVCILCGGRSTEHEVSLRSAANIAKAFDQSMYEISLVVIDPQGRWRLASRPEALTRGNKLTDHHLVLPSIEGRSAVLREEASGRALHHVDVFFPITHGTFGEDGCLQGLLRLLQVPFVGAGVLGSAVGMDKDVSKRLLLQAELPVARFVAFRDSEREQCSYEAVAELLGPDLFIKPASLGSSVGVARVNNPDTFARAVSATFALDRKLLVEEVVLGREIECAVLGNDQPQASVVGEVVVFSDFYSYEAKYLDNTSSTLEIPACIDDETTATIRAVAIKAFQVLECQGMARVDFFLKPDGTILINEINTLPGFTEVSMYPKLWEASGVSYAELLDRLVRLAIEQHRRESHLLRALTHTAP